LLTTMSTGPDWRVLPTTRSTSVGRVRSRISTVSRSPYVLRRSSRAAGWRTVAVTRSPRWRACSVRWRTRPPEAPVMNHWRTALSDGVGMGVSWSRVLPECIPFRS
jgi:hypothetical protein